MGRTGSDALLGHSGVHHAAQLDQRGAGLACHLPRGLPMGRVEPRGVQDGRFAVLQGNPGQTEISDITLEHIDVQLTNENVKAVNVKNLKLDDVIINGKPFSLKPVE